MVYTHDGGGQDHARVCGHCGDFGSSSECHGSHWTESQQDHSDCYVESCLNAEQEQKQGDGVEANYNHSDGKR